MPDDPRPMVLDIPSSVPVAGRKDVEAALEAGFSPTEIVFMLDLPEDTVVEDLTGPRRLSV